MISLLETLIGSLSSTIRISFDIDKTNHANDRQSRDSNNFISEKDILETVNLALPKISKLLLIDEINIEDSILITNVLTNLNIISVIRNNDSNLELTIVTVMVKKNFIPKKDTYQIKVK